MEQDHVHEQPPCYDHESRSLSLPSLPTDVVPCRHDHILAPLAPPPESQFRPVVLQAHYEWPSQNPLTAYYQPGPSQLSPKLDSPTGFETPDGHGRRSGSVLSIDDPDVRIAAEALGDLRADFVQTPRKRMISPLSTSQPPEPLLSLLTTSHPLIGTAIDGSLSAYNTSKQYSTVFRSSAEYVERRFTPVVNTVGSVGRMTGVEGGVRWFLGSRQSSHHSPSTYPSDTEHIPHKRRKIQSAELEVGDFESAPLYHSDQHPRRPSLASSTVESLPAYDDHRSPSYSAALVPQGGSTSPETGSGSWPSRLVLSTSGLSIAMSEDSLRSLKYCLSWLRWANEHIGRVISALKDTLAQYTTPSSPKPVLAIESAVGSGQLVVRSDSDSTGGREELNAKIAALKDDVLKTLKEVVDVVSRYAGGALPENARLLVRTHLTSLPQRFRLASAGRKGDVDNVEGGNSNDKGDAAKERQIQEGANRVLVLAMEGLDMMAQVSGVLDGTIVSAEEWCERLGRRGRGGAISLSSSTPAPDPDESDNAALGFCPADDVATPCCSWPGRTKGVFCSG